ncbi:MAG TPA: hypothetical protein VGK17_15910 [Propionicimonas sp.]
MPTDNEDQQHPVLPDKEDREQRGDNPPGSFGHTDPPSGDLAPGWTPNDDVRHEAEELIKELGREHRPHREDVYPYLMVRAFSPGDRGARPTWPSVPCWESPDILLIDASYAGPFTLSQLVASPTAGRRYRVFVRVWNLGLLPAVGVHVRGWYVNPGFFGGDPTNPAYQPQPIGGVMVNLDDRKKPGAMQVVELDHTWDIPADLTGHECLMVSASCPLDQWGGALDANNDRHVGQRNLTILAGTDSAKELLFTLGGLVTKTGTLELMHGGPAVTPLLRGVLGRARSEFRPGRLRAPSARKLRLGVSTPTGSHLLTMFGTPKGWLIADSGRLWALALQLGIVEEVGREGKAHPFATPLGTRRVIERVGLDRVEAFGVIVTAEPGEALLEGLVRLWHLEGLDASDLATALAEGTGLAHLLRFAHTDPERNDAGGYSVTVIA